MNRVEKQRIKEICNKVLEINKTVEDYVGIFVDGVPSNILNYQGKTLYFIFKDGNGQKELYDLTYKDCVLCYNNGLLEENSYKGFKRRQIFKFKINEVKKYLEK